MLNLKQWPSGVQVNIGGSGDWRVDFVPTLSGHGFILVWHGDIDVNSDDPDDVSCSALIAGF